MPARVPPGSRAWCPAGLGVLTRDIPPELVDEVIGLSGCAERRRRLLPARAVIYFVLGLCLFSGADSAGPPGYRSVMRWLAGGLRHLHGVAVPTSPALTRARQRLGSKPLELLFDLRRGMLAGEGTPGASAFGLRLVAWDGTGLDAADTPANAQAFGVTSGGTPQLRLLALTECGTRAVIDAAFGGVHASELKLARQLLHALRPGMLLLADRLFPGWELWGLAAAAGADLLWRLKKNQVLPPCRVLPDGSFWSVMPTPAESARQGQARARGRVLARPPEGHLVRVIEYDITIADAAGGTRTEPFRLVTTLLDHERAPAAQLAALYHQRWEAETGFADLKTRLRGAAFTLRSRTPNLVRQEIFAFLTVYQALSALRADAARTAGTDPDRISFTVTIRTARASAQALPSPGQRTQAIRDILADLLPRRRDRHYPRTRKPPKNTYPARKHAQTRPAGNITCIIQVRHTTQPPSHSP